MNRVKTLVVGVGALGRHHARILNGFEDVDLIAVADPSPVNGPKAAESLGTQWVEDYRSVIDQCDAVSIAAPTFLHEQVATDFLARSIPVLVEKPLTSNVASAQRLVDLAYSHKTTLQVGHIERFNPAYMEFAKRCAQPKYLKVERCSPFAFRSMDIGVVHDVMIHDIELLLNVTQCQPIGVEAFGVAVTGDFEDLVQARFYFPNGCVADVSASRFHPEAKRVWSGWSANGCCHADLQTRKLTDYQLSAADLPRRSLIAQASMNGIDLEILKESLFGEFVKVESPEFEPCDQLTDELRNFIHAVKKNDKPRVTGNHALEALKLADRVLESVKSHAWAPGDDLFRGPVPQEWSPQIGQRFKAA